MYRNVKPLARLAALLSTFMLVATVGCLQLSEPGSKGLSMTTLPDTTPTVIAPLSITMVAGPSASPAGLAYVFTVRNTADTAAGMVVPSCGIFTLRAKADTTAPTVAINYPPCTAFIATQSLQPGQSISYTRVLPNAYIASGTQVGDYFAWAQLAYPIDTRHGVTWPPVSARAGVVHWGG